MNTKKQVSKVRGSPIFVGKRTLMRPTSMYREAKGRLEELVEFREERKVALAKAPKGSMHVVCSRKRTRFYLRKDKSDKSGKYVPKPDAVRIGVYLQKAYDEAVIKLLNIEISIIEKCLKQSDGIIEKIRLIYSSKPKEVKQYLDPVDMRDDDYVKQWQEEPFKGKEITDSVPFYETKRKERVRSKSELNIANALDAHNNAYKYECPLTLNNGFMLYPDFTILDMKNRIEIYWEHRGMMDNEEYAAKTVARLKMMMKNGICVGKNLIITEETSTNPLGTDEIEAVINELLK